MGEVAIVAMREMQEKLVLAQAEIGRLQRENKKDSDKTSRELAEKERLNNKLKLKGEQLRGIVEEMREALEVTLAENTQLVVDLDSANSTAKALEEQLSDSKKELDLWRNCLNDSRSKCEKAMHELEIARSGRKEAEDAVDRERRAARDMLREVESCRSEKLFLEGKLQECAEKIADQDRDCAGWEQKYEMIASRLLLAEARAERLAPYEERVVELQAALSSERKARGRAESATLRAKIAFTGFQEEIEKFRHEVECQSSELQAIRPLAVMSGKTTISENNREISEALCLALRNSEATLQHVVHLDQAVAKQFKNLNAPPLEEIPHSSRVLQESDLASRNSGSNDSCGMMVQGSVQPSMDNLFHRETLPAFSKPGADLRVMQWKNSGENIPPVDCRKGPQVSSLPEQLDVRGGLENAAPGMASSLNCRKEDVVLTRRALAAKERACSETSKQSSCTSTINPKSRGMAGKKTGKPARNQLNQSLPSNKITRRPSTAGKAKGKIIHGQNSKKIL